MPFRKIWLSQQQLTFAQLHDAEIFFTNFHQNQWKNRNYAFKLINALKYDYYGLRLKKLGLGNNFSWSTPTPNFMKVRQTA
jgi:hypothetical protein